MGMFDGLLGGIVGAGMVSVLNSVIEKHGGLQGVISEFEKGGLGAGPDLLQQLAEKSGMSVQDLAQKLAQVLPQAVHKLTPNGAIPKA